MKKADHIAKKLLEDDEVDPKEYAMANLKEVPRYVIDKWDRVFDKAGRRLGMVMPSTLDVKKWRVLAAPGEVNTINFYRLFDSRGAAAEYLAQACATHEKSR